MTEIIPKFTKKSKKHAFIFVDPYGLQVKWETITKLGEQGTFDVYINFPIHGVTRQLRKEAPSEETREFINQIMGGPSWYDKVYLKSEQLSLIDHAPTFQRMPGIAEDLAIFYAENLKGCFDYVSDPRIMRQHTNSPLYALILASKSKLAIDKINEIYHRLDRLKTDS